MPKLFAPALSAEVGRPLLEAAERVLRLAPWEFMSDLEIIGMRDETEGKLHVASILGTLGTMFAVAVYRNDAGLRWIHDVVTNRAAPDPLLSLEEMDCLKVEWCRRKELQENELKTLKAAEFKPKGQGPIWPRFESHQPGWYPWGMTDAEARLMTELLRKVARFVHLRETSGLLHQEPIEARVPIVPAGEESTLRPEQIEWLPFVPRPAPPLAPVVLSAEDQDRLNRLPVRRNFIAELMAPLTPALAFLDEKIGRPCLARSTFMVDHDSHFVVCAELGHGAVPFDQVVGPAFVKALQNAKARPVEIHVNDPRLSAALRPLCEAIGVPLQEVPLEVALEAWEEFETYFSHQRPR